jgi:hypothetical protein
MTSLIAKLILPLMSFASEGGAGHSHGEGGETEHLYPVLIIFAVLVIGGIVFHFVSKKK